MCWPFKGKHPLKILVVENIDPLQVTIHSYTNLFFGNQSITFISMVHSLETAKFETVPLTIQIFQKSPTATFTTSSPDEESEASQPPSSLLHRLFRQPSAPGPLPSMMGPLFPLPLSAAAALRASLPPCPMGRLIANIPLLRTSSPSPPAPPHSSPRSISTISSMRDEGKVSILFALLAITPETHLLMFDGEDALSSSADLSSQNCGGLHSPLLPDLYRS